MSTPPGENYDTENVSGNPGPASRGTAERTGEKDTATSGAGGGGAVPAPPPVTPEDTSGTNGVNTPENYTPTDTRYTGTFETTLPGVSTDYPAYRAPNRSGVPGTIADTTRTEHMGDGTPPPATVIPWVTGTVQTTDFGAPGGTITTKTDTGLVLNAATPAALSTPGVLPGSIHVHDTTTNADLVEGTDYTVAFEGAGATATASITRVGTSTASADADTATVTYQVADTEYFATNLPTARPDAPTGVTATGHPGYVTVAWAAPDTGEVVNGYRIESSTGGVYFAAANVTSFDFHQLTPDVPYTFRVAAVNARGNGPFSAWTAPASATNPNLPES